MNKTLSIVMLCAMLLLSCFGNCAAAEKSSPTISVGKAVGTSGETVQVKVKVSNNPGIVTMRLNFEWDTDIVELKKAENGSVLSGSGVVFTTSQNTSDNPYTMSWISTATSNHTSNGTLAILSFKIKSDTKPNDKSTIKVSAKKSDILNVDLEKVDFTLKNGSVTVGAEKGSGDVNNDGKTNTGDAVLILRYTVGTFSMSDKQKKEADFNGDGKINSGDAVGVLRYSVGMTT